MGNHLWRTQNNARRVLLSEPINIKYTSIHMPLFVQVNTPLPPGLVVVFCLPAQKKNHTRNHDPNKKVLINHNQHKDKIGSISLPPTSYPADTSST